MISSISYILWLQKRLLKQSNTWWVDQWFLYLISSPAEEHETGIKYKWNQSANDTTDNKKCGQWSFTIFATLQIVRPIQASFVHLEMCNCSNRRRFYLRIAQFIPYRILYVETEFFVEGLMHVLVNIVHIAVTVDTIWARWFVVILMNAIVTSIQFEKEIVCSIRHCLVKRSVHPVIAVLNVYRKC